MILCCSLQKTLYNWMVSNKGVLRDAGSPHIILKPLKSIRELLGPQRATKLQQKVLFWRFNVDNSELPFHVSTLPPAQGWFLVCATSTAMLQSDKFSRISSLLHFVWLGHYSTSFWWVKVKTTVIVWWGQWINTNSIPFMLMKSVI